MEAVPGPSTTAFYIVFGRPPGMQPPISYEEYHLLGSLLPFPCLPCKQVLLDGNLTAKVIPEDDEMSKSTLRGNITALMIPEGKVLQGYIIGTVSPEGKDLSKFVFQGNILAKVTEEAKVLQGNVTAVIVPKNIYKSKSEEEWHG